MAVRGAARGALFPVTASGAGDRVIAAVPEAGPPELPADLDRARVQVHVFPAEPERLGLPDAHRERDRPARAVAAVRGGRKDAVRLFTGQRLDISLFAGRRVDEQGNVVAGLAAFPGDLQGAGQDPVDLQDGVRLELLPGEPGVEGVQVLGLEAVEPVPAELGDDPPADLRLIGAVQRCLGDRARCDGRQPCLHPVGDGEWLAGLAGLAGVARVSLAFEFADPRVLASRRALTAGSEEFVRARLQEPTFTRPRFLPGSVRRGRS